MFSYSNTPNYLNLLDIFKPLNKKKLNNDIKKLINDQLANYYLLSSSSWSLMSICEFRKDYYKKKKINLWVPDYYCLNALRLLNKSSVNIIYYPINEKKEFNIKNIKSKYIDADLKPDLIIGVHYFGKYHDFADIKNYAKLNDSWIIEDATHSSSLTDKIGKNGDFVLMSLYKHFAIPDGAILILKTKLLNKVKTNFIIDKYLNQNVIESLKHSFKTNILWIFKKFFLKLFHRYIHLKNKLYEEDIKNIKREYGFQHFKFSLISKKLLLRQINDINYVNINKNIFISFFLNYIENNFIEIENYLSFSNNFINYSNQYNFSLNLQHNEIENKYNLLAKRKMPVFLWPDLSNEIYYNDNSLAYKFFSQILHISITSSMSYKEIIPFFKTKTFHNKISIKTKEISKQELYNSYKDITNSNILQSYNYAKAFIDLSKINWDFKLLQFSYQNENAFCILYVKKIFFLEVIRINNGPIFSDNCSTDFKTNVLNYIISLGNYKKRKILFFKPNLNYNLQNLIYLKKKSLYMNPKPSHSSIFIDLKKDISLLKNNLKYFWKYSLNNAYKKNIEISITTNQHDFKVFCKKYNIDQKVNNFKGINSNLLLNMLNNNNDFEKIFLIQAKFNKQIYGEICIFISGYSSIYLCGSFSDYAKKNNFNNLLLWEAIIYLKKHNIKNFDLGGLSIKNNEGINFFKRGMGGEEIFYFKNILVA